jgi:hypothetical protein
LYQVRAADTFMAGVRDKGARPQVHHRQIMGPEVVQAPLAQS